MCRFLLQLPSVLLLEERYFRLLVCLGNNPLRQQVKVYSCILLALR